MDLQSQFSYTPQQHQYLINSLISILAIPKQLTNVSKDYLNNNNLAVEIQAYAKIAGNNWTYYVKDLEISIGRNTVDASTNQIVGNISIDLGPAKVVSRKHAVIKFNMQIGGWEIHLYGRNGAKINFKRVQLSSSPIPIHSGTVLDIGGTQMMFILPDQDPTISNNTLNCLISKLALLYDHSESENAQLLNKIIKSSEYYKTNTNNIQSFVISGKNDLNKNQISSMNNSHSASSSLQSNQIRTFKMYGNNGSTTPNSISNSNGMRSSNEQMLVPNNYSSNASNYPNSYNNLANSNGGFPPTIDFASDLSHDDNKNIKPPHSYATMITQAILSTEEGIISLADIYKFISSKYAYYRYATSGWQNSIRHNLSLNKAFEKVPRKPNEPGKGMKWRISNEYREDFMNKWNTGKISKIRRGSSVARQLQLHMSKYNSLPTEKISSNKPAFKQNIHPLQQSHTYLGDPNMNSNGHHQYQNSQDTINNEMMMAGQQSGMPRIPNNHNPTNSALVSFNAAAAGSLNSMAPASTGTTNSASAHMSDQNNTQKQHDNDNSDERLIADSDAQNSMNNKNNSSTNYDKNKTLPTNSNNTSSNGTSTTGSALLPPANSTSTNTNSVAAQQTAFSTNLVHLSPPKNPLTHSPTRAFHVTAMEAYTPERGSTHARTSSKVEAMRNAQTDTGNPLDTDKNLIGPALNAPSSNKSQNGRSSPNVWNLLQLNSVTNTPNAVNHFPTATGASSVPNEVPNPNDNIVSSPIKTHTQLASKELILDTDSAKVTIVNH